MMLNFGVFYQSGHKIVPCFLSLERFRKTYPAIPIVMYEDGGSNILKPVADNFNCFYKRVTYEGINYEDCGKPFYDLETAFNWFERIHNACNNELKDVDWIMIYEDDVWIEREIQGDPPFDLTGIHGFYINDELKKYIGSDLPSNFGRGGSIFKKTAFLEAYEIWKTLNWDEILTIDKSPVEWGDCAITFMFDCAKKSIGGWVELAHCNFFHAYQISNRSLWEDAPQKVDKNTEYAAVIHGYKAYYFPTEAEIDYINKKLNERNN